MNKDHVLYRIFDELVNASITRHVSSRGDEQIQEYLTRLLIAFLHTDSIFAVRDQYGHRLMSVADMIAEGDIRLNADSFEREREVHRHIGDFILFWSGLYPEFLRQIKMRLGQDLICDYNRQAKESYHFVSTFDQEPFSSEAEIFKRLSEGFDDYAFCLGVVRDSLDATPWMPDGNA